MRHNNNVLAPLKFHDDGLQTYDDVAIALTATVPVVVLVVVARLEVFGVLVGDFLVGETVADTRVELVEGFPFELVVAL